MRKGTVDEVGGVASGGKREGTWCKERVKRGIGIGLPDYG